MFSPIRSPLLKLGNVLAIASLCMVLGGHWLVLQTVAWGGMIVSYAREASLSEAVEKTFDGEHPCSMCIAIEEGRGEEKQKAPASARADLDLKFLVPDRAASPMRFPTLLAWERTREQAASRSHTPPHRPPRLA